MTIRLLCQFENCPPNSIITLDAGTEAGLVASKQASMDLAGGTAFVPQAGALQTRSMPFTVRARRALKVALAEGQAIIVTGAAGTAGKVERLDVNDNVAQAWRVGAGPAPKIGAFPGQQKVLITCTAGSIDAEVINASTGLAGIAPGAVLKKSYQSDAASIFPDGSPRATAKNSSVGALLVECSTNYAATAGSPTLSVVSGLIQSGIGAGTPEGVVMDLTNGLVGTPVSKTGLPRMLKCVTTSATTSISWRCNLKDGSGITSATLAAAILEGNFLLAVWIGRLPGQDVGGAPAGQIQCVLTMANNGVGGAIVGFNNNQLKEGWGFLKFQDTRAKSSAGGQPLGIATASLDDAQSPFLAANAGAVRNITVNISGLPIGTTVIFDSFWTGIKSRAAFVLGCDGGGPDLEALALPKMNQYGFKGYLALPRSSQNVAWPANVTRASCTADWSVLPSVALAASAAGWSLVGHSMTHPNAPFPTMNQMTAAEDIRYEATALPAYLRSRQLPTEGTEFYASSQGSSSRLTELVIRQSGIKLQRVYSQQNVQRTPWGFSNPHSVGSFDFADQTYQGSFAAIKKTIDTLFDYGDVGLGFWHYLTTAGDDGTGKATGDSLYTNKSTFDMVVDYLALGVAADKWDVLTLTQLYYETQ